LDNTTWQSTTSGAYAIYDNDAANNTAYGKLYNWYAVNDSRGLCPAGWHVPSDAEWTTLETSLGGSAVAGGKMKTTTGWNAPNTGANNSSGFTGLPGDYRSFNGTYEAVCYCGAWWSSSGFDSNHAWFRILNYDNSALDRTFNRRQNGFSVRCVKDSETSPIQGCTDGSACNFLADATQDDGSCLYQNATCDDGDVNTTNDVINSDCVCAGIILPPPLYTMGNGVTDIEGNFYPSILINGQEWMQKNLAVSKYRNGDPIPTGFDNATWQSTTSGAYAIYNNDAANNTTYGKLYNWYAVNDSRGLCPTGWHVPSDSEWNTLINYLDANQDSAAYASQSSVAGAKMKSTSGWNSPNSGASNESGFTGLPGGFRTDDGYYDIGYFNYISSSSEFLSIFSWGRLLRYDVPNLYRNGFSKNDGLSVRCVRD
jgi:uncharacterized protein (TIGR02145 family)